MAQRVAGIIPARYASTRFEGKPLADLAGKPMVQHVYERSRRASVLDDLLVATDDERIAAAVKSFGGKVVMTRPDHATGTDRLAEVCERLQAEIVVNIQGDEPLIEPAAIEQAVAPLIADPTIPMGTLMNEITSEEELLNPNVVKVVVDNAGFALYFSRSPLPYPRPGTWGKAKFHQHVGLYVYRRDFLMTYARLPQTPLEQQEKLEQLRALEHGYKIRVVLTEHRTIGVDTPEDLERVRSLLAQG
jgi:3-deoxy-manno-octulosonate cytidylyltransferase (CMP-KDO synthetase)